MSDVRALLRAKRQEVRVSHPLASYTSGGQLRCIACGTIVKHGTSWEGHIGSKAHRTNAARRREEERRHEEERARQRKRKAEDADADEEDADDADDATPSSKKQRMEEEEEEQRDVPQPAVPARPAGFPADFFSNPSRAPPPPSDDDGSDDETAPPAAAAAAAPSAIDAEWEQFQAAVIDAPDAREAYERATVFAEPVLSVETPQGFPAREGPADGETEERPVVPDEGELRRRREQEERELIMDRLLDEEQAQEEADAKVSVLKNKLDALKKQREAARAAKGKQKRS